MLAKLACVSDLLPGERVVMTIRRHPLMLAGKLWAPVLIAVCAVAATILFKLPWWVAALGLAIGVLASVSSYFEWWASSLTLTDQRVILSMGFLSRESRVIPLNKIQDMVVKQTVAGRLFDYGTIEVDAAGKGVEVLGFLQHPSEFRNEVFSSLERGQRPPVVDWGVPKSED